MPRVADDYNEIKKLQSELYKIYILIQDLEDESGHFIGTNEEEEKKYLQLREKRENINA